MPMRRKPLSETLGNGAVVDLIDRARQGDAAVLPELRKLFDRDPTIWRQAGDLGRRAEAAWVNLIAGTDVTLAESLRRRLAEMKRDLAAAIPPRWRNCSLRGLPFAGWRRCTRT